MLEHISNRNVFPEFWPKSLRQGKFERKIEEVFLRTCGNLFVLTLAWLQLAIKGQASIPRAKQDGMSFTSDTPEVEI